MKIWTVKKRWRSEAGNDNDLIPIVIEKQPRKKQEKQSKAQLETLCCGHERLAEKHKQQHAIKNNQVTHVSAWLKKCNQALQKLKEKEHVQVQPQVQQVHEVQEVQKPHKFYVWWDIIFYTESVDYWNIYHFVLFIVTRT